MSDKRNGNWWMEIDRQSDVDTLEGSKEAKELLLEFDQLEVPDDDAFFEKLHGKIMAGVEMTSPKKDTRTFLQKNKKVVRGISAAAMLMAILLVGLDTQQVRVTVDGTDQVLSDAVSRSDIEETVLVYQNKDDFFVDLAQESLDHLSVDRLHGLMGSQLTD